MNDNILGHPLRRALVCALFANLLTTVATAREIVTVPDSFRPGTVVVVAHQRKLFYVISPHIAIRYPVAVPKAGKEWSGDTFIGAKYVAPAWSPPPAVRHDHPNMPTYFDGGSPSNPMGARALTLGDLGVAIHGTSGKTRASIGTAASYGCVRMLNEDISDLYDRVDVGTRVIMER